MKSCTSHIKTCSEGVYIENTTNLNTIAIVQEYGSYATGVIEYDFESWVHATQGFGSGTFPVPGGDGWSQDQTTSNGGRTIKFWVPGKVGNAAIGTYNIEWWARYTPS